MQNKVYMHDQVSNKVNEIMIHLKRTPLPKLFMCLKALLMRPTCV